MSARNWNWKEDAYPSVGSSCVSARSSCPWPGASRSSSASAARLETRLCESRASIVIVKRCIHERFSAYRIEPASSLSVHSSISLPNGALRSPSRTAREMSAERARSVVPARAAMSTGLAEKRARMARRGPPALFSWLSESGTMTYAPAERRASQQTLGWTRRGDDDASSPSWPSGAARKMATERSSCASSLASPRPRALR
mmetsp:Transcript_6596/g.20777  ORF Transcript_6596/g.20777 Transcript_6596/m.20777 type:complete len:201 (-) Transcript_6596:960-1562(-)